MQLPNSFCWTRFGSEAGQNIDDIFFRKNQERKMNAGIFLWGIGNNVTPSIGDLLQLERHPKVIFSPIKSAPRPCDVSPAEVAVWTAGVGYDGKPYRPPAGSLVTSRYSGKRATHFALVCSSESELKPRIDCNAQLQFNQLKNLRTDRKLGSSQVTAVVSKREADLTSGAIYPVTLVADLVYPYVVKFTSCVTIKSAGQPIDQVMQSAWGVRQAALQTDQNDDDRQFRLFG